MLSKIKDFIKKFKKQETFEFKPFESDEITFEQLKKFMAVHGEKGSKTLSIAGKLKPFYTALNTEIGQIILNDLLIKMEVLLDKIIEESATKKDLAEYRVVRKLLINWSNKIALYEETKKKIKET
jgi:hypothetical protein